MGFLKIIIEIWMRKLEKMSIMRNKKEEDETKLETTCPFIPFKKVKICHIVCKNSSQILPLYGLFLIAHFQDIEVIRKILHP